MPKTKNIYMIECESLQMVSELILNLNMGFIWFRKGFRLFGPTIPCDTTRTLCLHGGCL